MKNPRPYVKDAFGRFLINNDPTRDQPQTHRHESRVPLRFGDRAGRDRNDSSAAHRHARQSRRSTRSAFDAHRRRAASPKPTRSTTNLLPANCDAAGPHDPAPRVRRFAVDEAMVQLRHPRLAQGRSADAAAAGRAGCTAATPSWTHLYNEEILSMPDEWEYPWYASWDLAFHVIPFALIDPDFAKRQLVALTRERYMHPERSAAGLRVGVRRRQPAGARVGRLPHLQDRSQAARRHGRFAVSSSASSRSCCLNFTWWVNRKDVAGRNVFQGGFLGLDNIGDLRPQHQAADRRLPRASRRHGVDGASTRSTCWRSRSNSRATIRCTSIWPTSSSSTSSTSPTR